jgi:glutathione synthase/RimK-type ligase-like ATP-grasp enzyme
MILIITHKTDFTADFVINKLNQKGINYKRFNCEDINIYKYCLELNNQFNYSILGERNFRSVWFRRTRLPDINCLKREDKMYLLNETDSFFKNLFATIESNWLSEPNAVYQAENKLLQLKIAQKVGFSLPPTIVTSSKEELARFYIENDKDIIIKPISQTRIQYQNNAAFVFTNKVLEQQINEIDKFDLTPCIFQKNIQKECEIRATVIENMVFASAVYSQKHSETKNDWRRKKLDFFKIDLPKKVNDLCVDLLKALNLKFGAIDLIKTPNDDYVFLEINPNGQWAWIERQTGQDISGAIIDFLTRR